MRDAPKLRPGTWDLVCEECGAFVQRGWPSPSVRHEGCPLGLVAYPEGGRTYSPRTRGVAIWGHEWSAVAWMASHQLLLDSALENIGQRVAMRIGGAAMSQLLEDLRR